MFVAVLFAAIIALASAFPLDNLPRSDPYDGNSYNTAVVGLSPAAYWPLHGTSPTSETPVVSTLGVQVVGQPPLVNYGQYYFRYFKGQSYSTRAFAPWDPQIMTQHWTVSVWLLRLNGYNGYFKPAISTRYFASCGTSSGNTAGYYIGLDSSNRFYVILHTGVNSWITLTGQTSQYDRWYHVTVTKSATHLKLYVDGNLIATNLVPSTVIVNPYSNFNIASEDTCVGNGKWYGYIGDIAVWNYALDFATIRSLAIYRNTASGYTCRDTHSACQEILDACNVMSGSGCTGTECTNTINSCTDAYNACALVSTDCNMKAMICPTS